MAAALDVSREAVSYEGQAAIELEALACAGDAVADAGYPFAQRESTDGRPLQLDPAPMWRALLDDLRQGVPRARMAARFHAGLATAVAELARRLAAAQGADTVALSGGVLQNRTLFEALSGHLRSAGLQVLAQQQVPANDGGLALGQAVAAAAQALAAEASEN